MIDQLKHLEIAFSKSGEEVLIVDGKATASLVDPIKESKSWMESVRPMLLKEKERIVVLGIGSGYHLRLLGETEPDLTIVAIDTCEKSIQFCSKKQLKNVQFVFISQDELRAGAQSVVAADAVRDWILDPFTLIRHRATMARNRDLLRVESWILGRSAEALRAHLALRPSIAAILNSQKLHDVASMKLKTVDVFSIRDFVSCCDIKSDPSHERRLLRVLEELVR